MFYTCYIWIYVMWFIKYSRKIWFGTIFVGANRLHKECNRLHKEFFQFCPFCFMCKSIAPLMQSIALCAFLLNFWFCLCANRLHMVCQSIARTEISFYDRKLMLVRIPLSYSQAKYTSILITHSLPNLNHFQFSLTKPFSLIKPKTPKP